MIIIGRRGRGEALEEAVWALNWTRIRYWQNNQGR